MLKCDVKYLNRCAFDKVNIKDRFVPVFSVESLVMKDAATSNGVRF